MRIATRLMFVGVFALVAVELHGDDSSDGPSVFDRAGLHEMEVVHRHRIESLLAQGKLEEAEKRLQETLKRTPRDTVAHYNLACVLARQGKHDEALAALEKAVEFGFRNPRHIEQDEDLKCLRGEPRFASLLKRAAEPLATPPESQVPVEPAPIRDGQAIVTEKCVRWDAGLGVFRVFVNLDQEATANQPIVDGPVAQTLGTAGELLRTWYGEKTAAGNHGDLYDNHDGDHANMKYQVFPQLTRIEFDESARKRGLHFGLQLRFFYNGVTLGNSSTALTSGPMWRSQGRHALTSPRGPALLYLQYVGNHLFVYPEHRDHDPGHNGAGGKGHGDVFPANTPYMILSQGSSGSDVAFLNAIAATLAAFRPEVKAELVRSGLLMPTVQMVIRRSNRVVETPEDYFAGKAHPTVFDSRQLDVEKMVTLAHAITPKVLPPMVQLRVVEEDQPVLGREVFDIAVRERLFDTPCAIARVIQSTKYERRMVVSAEGSKDLRGRPLTYRWAVLRGDADRIRIRKLNDSGSVVELVVAWHERQPVLPGSELESNRVDIGGFVDNGVYASAPAFVSFTFPDNQRRVYDSQQRILAVDYADPAVRSNYVDPVLDIARDWRDEYHYADDGRLLGWTRVRVEEREEFTPEGLLIAEKDAQGKAIKTCPVRYVALRQKDGRLVLKQEPAEEPAPPASSNP